MPQHELPLYTQAYATIEEFSPARQSVYICARSVEQRSEHLSAWASKAEDVSFVDISAEDRHSIRVSFDGGEDSVALRSNDQIRRLWAKIQRPTIYVDITGLRHHVWAV